MAKSFKNIPSLHTLLESAPVEAIKDFLDNIDAGVHATCFATISWFGDTDGGVISEDVRPDILKLAAELPPETAIPLEQHAQRVLNLAEGRGVETLSKVDGRIFDSENAEIYAKQRDDYGRALFLYCHEEELFDEAENIFYADHHRNQGRLYEAFEVDTNGQLEFEWNIAIQEAIERELHSKLDLTSQCKIDHISFQNEADNGSAFYTHLLIIRHAGPLSSVAEMKEGHKKPIYYRPAIEASLLFSPKDAVIEVFANNPGMRPILATVFAKIGLKHDLSERPLMLRQYNLSRFLSSLKLDVPNIHGFNIETASVVEAEVRPDNLKHRASLRVTPNDDIEAVALDLFGQNSIFTHPTIVSRVVIAIRYFCYADGDGKTKSLNITLSDPNRCNLRSNRDPKQRDLGFDLLAHWGIMQKVRPLDATEESAIFPALLLLYDRAESSVSRRHFDARGIPVTPLLEGGFIVRRGRQNQVEVELDSGEIRLVTIKGSKMPGYVEYECPLSKQSITIPTETLENFEIKREWIEERIIKGLRAALKPVGKPTRDDSLIFLGHLDLEDQQVPIYLARQLADFKKVRDYDVQLRGNQGSGVGIVLSCAEPELSPQFLGPHVVIPLVSMLVNDVNDPIVDIDRLMSVYIHGKALARGAKTVDFVVDRKRTATLWIPGKLPLTVLGDQQIKVIQRLVNAHHAGNPAVATKDLIEGTGVQSPSQLFRNWKDTIVDVYIGQSDKRGAWKLLV